MLVGTHNETYASTHQALYLRVVVLECAKVDSWLGYVILSIPDGLSVVNYKHTQ